MAKWFDQVREWLKPQPDTSARAENAPDRPILSRLAWWLALLLLLWLPVSPFLVTITGWRWLSLLRELLTLALCLVGLQHRRRARLPLIAGDVERLIIWLVGWSLLGSWLISHDALAWLWSARYNFIPLAAFWALHGYSPTAKQWRQLLVIWFSWSGLLFLFGLLMVFVIPQETLIAWGYSATVAVGSGQWVGGATLPAYQAVAGGIPRLQSTLTGPIQLAGFAAIVFWLLRSARSWQPPFVWQRALFALTILMIVGTFSRSVWLALLLIGLVFWYRRLRQKGVRRRDLTSWTIGGGVLLLAVFGLIFMAPNNEGLRYSVGRILAREGSDQEHAASIADSLSDWREIGFFGLGFGRSGAGSIQYASANPQAPLPRFVDNSYLRWWEELGVPGAALFLAIIWLLVSDTRRRGETGRYLSAAGQTLILSALLTDMWAEAVPYFTWLILIALWHAPDSRSEKERAVGPFSVSGRSLEATVTLLGGWQKRREPHAVVTLNPEMYVAARQDKDVAAAITQADLITADGAGIVAAADVARQLQGWRLPRWRWLMAVYLPIAWLMAGLRLIFTPHRLPLAKVTGADLVARLRDQSGRTRWALLGSTPPVVARARDILAANPDGPEVVYAESGPLFSEPTVPKKTATKLAAALSARRPDLLLVAFGVPRQERFIIENKRDLNVPVMIGVSGAFDSVLAGTVTRAPRLLRAINLEWLWRLLRQPGRIGRIWTATWRFLRTVSRDLLN